MRFLIFCEAAPVFAKDVREPRLHFRRLFRCKPFERLGLLLLQRRRRRSLLRSRLRIGNIRREQPWGAYGRSGGNCRCGSAAKLPSRHSSFG